MNIKRTRIKHRPQGAIFSIHVKPLAEKCEDAQRARDAAMDWQERVYEAQMRHIEAGKKLR